MSGKWVGSCRVNTLKRGVTFSLDQLDRMLPETKYLLNSLVTKGEICTPRFFRISSTGFQVVGTASILGYLGVLR